MGSYQTFFANAIYQMSEVKFLKRKKPPSKNYDQKKNYKNWVLKTFSINWTFYKLRRLEICLRLVMGNIGLGLAVLVLFLQKCKTKTKTKTVFILARSRPRLNKQDQDQYQDYYSLGLALICKTLAVLVLQKMQDCLFFFIWL